MTLPEPSRRERKKDETRQRIFDAAISLFRERGFEATTVDEITEKADVGRGTFFNYFHRKEAIFAYLAEAQTAGLEEVLPSLLDSDLPTRECLIRLFQLAAEPYVHDRGMARLVFAEWIKHDVSAPQETETKSRVMIHELLERGRNRGEFRTDVDDVRATAIFKGVFLATLFQWLYCNDDCPENIRDLGAELRARLEIAVDGVGSRTEVRS
jgi:AcrR family transcriptional regulator